MFKRPLDPRFNEAVKTGRKVTTIRDVPWAPGRKIMLYNWEGRPYRSKHVDVVPVVVQKTTQVTLRRSRLEPRVLVRDSDGTRLDDVWKGEGFASREEFDEWFLPMLSVAAHSLLFKYLMEFEVST